jgi:hypothetical protein
VKKPRNNFARCSTCDKIHALRKVAILESQAQALWAHKLKLHLTLHGSIEKSYYTNHYHLQFFPGECVTIMHDKMDHAKTAFPAFSCKPKQHDGLMKLLLLVIGMLLHDHGDVCYVHYGLDLYAHDSNYRVDSLAKLLQGLEMPLKSSSRQLFDWSKLSQHRIEYFPTMLQILL